MRAWNGSVYSFLRKRGLGVRVDRQGVGEGVFDGGDSTQGARRGCLRKRSCQRPGTRGVGGCLEVRPEKGQGPDCPEGPGVPGQCVC